MWVPLHSSRFLPRASGLPHPTPPPCSCPAQVLRCSSWTPGTGPRLGLLGWWPSPFRCVCWGNTSVFRGSCPTPRPSSPSSLEVQDRPLAWGPRRGDGVPPSFSDGRGIYVLTTWKAGRSLQERQRRGRSPPDPSLSGKEKKPHPVRLPGTGAKRRQDSDQKSMAPLNPGAM